jgi:hypothetical protein
VLFLLVQVIELMLMNVQLLILRRTRFISNSAANITAQGIPKNSHRYNRTFNVVFYYYYYYYYYYANGKDMLGI